MTFLKNGMVLNMDIYIQHIHHLYTYIFRYLYITTVMDLSSVNTTVQHELLIWSIEI